MWQFANGSPYLFTFIIMCVSSTFIGFLRCIFLIINRCYRHRNIKEHGWPPEYCDADGDFKPEPEPKLKE